MSRTAVDLVLARLRAGARVERVLQGAAWILAVVRDPAGRRAAGMAGIPHAMEGRCCLPLVEGAPRPAGPGEPGVLAVPGDDRDAVVWAEGLRAPEPGVAATGLAVANALLGLEPERAAAVDGVDWLLARAQGRSVAVVGRFPFIDRALRPIASRVWIVERTPRAGEWSEADAAEILPQADLVVITGGTLVNGTLDGFVGLAAPDAELLLLGPSTPLTRALFDLGFDALSGVRARDVDQVVREVAAGVPYRRMEGLERVTLLAP